MSRVETRIGWMQDAVRRPWLFHGQALQRGRRRSWSQPEGPAVCGHIAALWVVRLERLNFTPHALHCTPQTTGAGHDSY
jgi:hypothetical protein